MKKLSRIALTVFIFSVFLAVCGCNEGTTKINDDGDKVTAFKGGRYMRINVDGVDCIVGVGTYDTTVAITCDWASKKDR